MDFFICLYGMFFIRILFDFFFDVMFCYVECFEEDVRFDGVSWKVIIS